MSKSDPKLFSSVKYFTTGFRDSTIETLFKQHGAVRSFYLTETTTHVICDDFESNQSELEQAIEIYQTPIVTSDWISACLKCNTLLPVDPFRSADSQNNERLFRSCTFANANSTKDDHDKIYALATFYGGRWVVGLDGLVCTHIICASALPKNETDGGDTNNNHDERLHDAYEIQSEKVHLITPDWLIDCLNANRILDEADYHPDLLRDPNDPNSMEVDEDEDEEDEQINQAQSTDEHTSVKTSGHNRTQLNTKNFFNQSDQTTPPPSAEQAQGTNEANTTDATPAAKSQAPKRSRTRTTTTTPRQRATKSGTTPAALTPSNNNQPQFNGHAFGKDSNFSILPIDEKLIRPSVLANILANKNYLTSSRQPTPESQSYELNYCLQDKHELVPSSQCLLGCIIYVDEREYVTTVSKTDISTWSQTITSHGAVLTDDVNHANLTHFVCAYRTSNLYRLVCKRGTVRLVTAHWLNDVLQRKKLFVPNLAIHYPAPFEPSDPEKLPLAKYFITLTGFEGIERARLRYMIRSLGGKYSGHLGKWHTHLLARDVGKSEKYKKALEWSIPIVNGLWLSELFLGNTCALKEPLEDRYKRLNGSPSIDHFSFDQIFVHDLLVPWSQSLRISDEMLNGAIRRHNEQQHVPNTADSDTVNADLNGNAKRAKPGVYTEPVSTMETSDEPMLIMLSGFNAKMLNHYETIIKSLGGKISTLPHYTTHLIMNKFLRTEKLYECMGYVSFVLNKKWLDKCESEKRFLSPDETDWLLDDELKPPRNMLKQSIEKRILRKNRPLFTGYTFFLTPTVQPSQTTLKSIIFSAGGNIRRNFPTIAMLTTHDEQTKIPHCLILSCDIDKLLLKDLHKHNNTDFEIKILSIDYVLESIVQQEILNMDAFIMKM